ncbi:hypothetical protein C8A01DRAFT_15529 [Parachaetomium inaequale]|uniref:Uncharacterized protein n=1 Tax=Parachaetomium inaequale TaxID=2588326 RepID=A0AAN6PIA8_9PEZI|nr:hypothetical protein C8A01DRAFT_15529 [Parachaetomium inaequale]
MKPLYLLGTLAYGLRVEARRAPAAGVAARQWGEGGGGFGGWPGRGGGGSGVGGAVCEWTDHCLGDSCETENDCDGDLICRAGSCANAGAAQPTLTVGAPTPILRTTTITVTATPTTPSNPTCEWTGHCAGDPCQTENDCDGEMTCRAGKCGDASAPVATSTRRIRTSTRRVVTSTRRVVTSTRRVVTSTRPVVTSIRRTTTSTRRATIPPVPTRSTVQPQPTTTQNPPTPGCSDSPLACIGVSCQTDADCGGSLIICNDGVCGL